MNGLAADDQNFIRVEYCSRGPHGVFELFPLHRLGHPASASAKSRYTAVRSAAVKTPANGVQ